MRSVCSLLAPLLFLLLFAQLSWAEDSSKVELVQRLVKLDGTELQLGSLHAQMLEGIKPYAKKMPPDDFAQLQKSVEINFDGKQLFENYREVMVGQISEGDLKQALTWFESPLGRRLSQLQSDSATPQAIAEMRRLATTVDKIKPPVARDQLLKNLDSTLKASDLLVDLSVNLANGVAAGVLSIRNDVSQDEITDVRRRLGEMRRRLRPQITHSTYITNLYTYRDVTDSDLKTYIAFFKTKAGHNVIEASFFALNDSLQKAAEEVGKEMGRLRRAKEAAAAKQKSD